MSTALHARSPNNGSGARRAARTHAAVDAPAAAASRHRAGVPGQVVLVFQGGGALGAYQVGVYEAFAA